MSACLCLSIHCAAWKSDHKCQSYRRRREHERKWAISASLRKGYEVMNSRSKSNGSRERNRLKIGSQIPKLSKTTRTRTKVKSVFETSFAKGYEVKNSTLKSCNSGESNRLKIGSQVTKLSKTTRTRTKVIIFSVFGTFFAGDYEVKNSTLKSCNSGESNRLKIGSQVTKLSKTTRTRTKVSIFSAFKEDAVDHFSLSKKVPKIQKLKNISFWTSYSKSKPLFGLFGILCICGKGFECFEGFVTASERRKKVNLSESGSRYWADQIVWNFDTFKINILTQCVPNVVHIGQLDHMKKTVFQRVVWGAVVESWAKVGKRSIFRKAVLDIEPTKLSEILTPLRSIS